jgi:hypothetical protein
LIELTATFLFITYWVSALFFLIESFYFCNCWRRFINLFLATVKSWSNFFSSPLFEPYLLELIRNGEDYIDPCFSCFSGESMILLKYYYYNKINLIAKDEKFDFIGNQIFN